MWRLIVDGPRDGSSNMAADARLLESDIPTLRLYSWSEPTVSLGYGQSRAPVTDLPMVRRPSGGRALLHNQELTYAIALPDSGWSVTEAFELLTGGLGHALSRLGIEVRSNKLSARSGSEPSCMALVQRGELYSRRGKLVGSAQVRRGGRLLQHGVIPWAYDRDLLESVFPGHPPVWGVEELGYSRFEPQALAEALGEVWGITWSA